ncbi:MAG: superoxide dismutase [Cyanobacteria bacterium HKST-UBA06]|nr:superoxide dismutase [Cyanobacteria bacterium HKST-UBA06]MCA9842828.1 superoxide dismutase [Cyanobacteria bacterium HKST-UBA03]
MAVATLTQYEAKTYGDIAGGLDGISKEQLDTHFKLYQGYVNNFNTVVQKTAALLEAQDFGPVFNELKRRYAFEFNGVRLHELYFGNLKNQGGELGSGALRGALEAQFGSYDAWATDFKKTGALRGIGWAVLFQDEETGRLFNFFINDHENGMPVGLTPILVMDVWEHAYTGDYKATERGNYIEAFFRNINWPVVEARFGH